MSAGPLAPTSKDGDVLEPKIIFSSKYKMMDTVQKLNNPKCILFCFSQPADLKHKEESCTLFNFSLLYKTFSSFFFCLCIMAEHFLLKTAIEGITSPCCMS